MRPRDPETSAPNALQERLGATSLGADFSHRPAGARNSARPTARDSAEVQSPAPKSAPARPQAPGTSAPNALRERLGATSQGGYFPHCPAVGRGERPRPAPKFALQRAPQSPGECGALERKNVCALRGGAGACPTPTGSRLPLLCRPPRPRFNLPFCVDPRPAGSIRPRDAIPRGSGRGTGATCRAVGAFGGGAGGVLPGKKLQLFRGAGHRAIQQGAGSFSVRS